MRSIANLHESMAWISKRIDLVLQALVNRSPQQLSEMWVDVGPVYDVLLDDEGLTQELIELLVTQNQPAPLKDIISDIRKVSDCCLVLLRLEIRSHCLMHLLPAVRKSNYNCDVEQIEADPQVVLLCKDLSALHELLLASLHPLKVAYLFDDLDAFVSEVLVQNLIHIKVQY